MTDFLDIHCHILPGLDDGAKDRVMMEQMLQAAYKDGTRGIIATSHYNPSVFAYSTSEYEQRLMLAKIIAADIADDFHIYDGSEIFYTSSSVEDILSQKVKTLADSYYVLIEFAPYEDYSYILKAVRDITRAGFLPIIAHIERYETILKTPQSVKELISEGAYIQINAAHIFDPDKKKTRNFIHSLLKNKEVHFIASDAHSISGRNPKLMKCAELIVQKYGEDLCRELMLENPQKIISGKVI